MYTQSSEINKELEKQIKRSGGNNLYFSTWYV